MKISIKREQNQASLSFAERKKFRPKVKHKRLQLLLALLLTAVTGAWADELTVYDGTFEEKTSPAYIGYSDEYTRSQTVIPSTALTAMKGCDITAMTFYSNSFAASGGIEYSFDVYLKEVSYTAFTESSPTFEPKSSCTSVHQGKLSFSNHELTITFSKPFHYKGGNLLIGMENTSIVNYYEISFLSRYTSSSLSNISIHHKTDLASATTIVTGYFIPKTTFTYVVPTYSVKLADGTQDAANWTIASGENSAKGDAADGLTGLKEGDAVTLTYGGRLKVKGVTATTDAEPETTYLKWDATQQKLVEAEIPATATKVVNATKAKWEAGTYLVEGNVTINGDIQLTGNVNLIIKDGAKLTAKQVYASNNISLNIYGQSNGSGELNVVCSGGNAISTMSELNIHGCKVIASSSSNGSGGIGAIGTLNVYDGSVDAKNTYSGYGIYINQNGSLNIYGGQVKAEGKGATTKSYGITGSSGVTVTVYGGKLWAGCADNAAFKSGTSGITLKKGEGFTGTIQTSSDDSTYNTYSGTNTPTTKYVRVVY